MARDVPTATAASYFLPQPAIREFKRRHSGVAVQLLVLTIQEFIDAARRAPRRL